MITTFAFGWGYLHSLERRYSCCRVNHSDKNCTTFLPCCPDGNENRFFIHVLISSYIALLGLARSASGMILYACFGIGLTGIKGKQICPDNKVNRCGVCWNDRWGCFGVSRSRFFMPFLCQLMSCKTSSLSEGTRTRSTLKGLSLDPCIFCRRSWWTIENAENSPGDLAVATAWT